MAPGQARPVGEDAQCLIASITKPIVATAVMRLHQEGRFALDAPLALWLPELASPDKRAITAWHVLTHTTGMEHTWLDRLLAGEPMTDRSALIARAMAAPLAAPVGSAYAYATLTFDVLTTAIERAMDCPFEAILRETVLDPLRMTSTDWEPEPARAAPLDVLQWEDDWRPSARLADADVAPLRHGLVRLHLAGAGLHSTAADLVRFGRALLRGGELDGTRILAPVFVDLMTREVTVRGLGRQADRALDNHYAIGWGKRNPTSPMSPSGFEHGGATGTRLLVDPEHDLVIVSLTGVWAHPRWTVDEAISGVYAALR
jgi:CubicO group peptidase (beta-lactamase class C family)